jgi:peptidoglycan/LPS O-acetylase OafA/YrhL
VSKKIYSIEILRFFASISVLIYHYKIFFFIVNKFYNFNYSNPSDNLFLSSLPFNSILNLLYKYGDNGVQVFWCISGFIMSYVYLEQKNKINGKSFFLNRFSRLYPLHFATLILIVILQKSNLILFGNFLVFDNNNFYNFLLHLFFISGWGFQEGLSFNEPIWSVSLELIAYFLFFFSIKMIKNINYLKIVIFYIILLFLNKYFFNSYKNQDIISCIQLFLSGVLVFKIYKKFSNLNFILFSIFLLTISILGSFKIFIFCPAIIMVFLISEQYIIRSKLIFLKFFSLLGNLTYSSYLLHAPLSIIFIMLVNENTLVFLSPIFFMTYFTIVIFFSILSYYLFEKKLKNLIRKRKNTLKTH